MKAERFHVVRKLLDGLYLLGGVASGCFLVAILVLMMGLSLGRQVGVDIPAGDDFAAWSMAASAFLGLAHTFRSGDMIRVGLLVDKLEGRARWAAECLCLVVALGFVGFFAFHAVEFTRMSWVLNDRATGVVAMPLWIPQLGYSGGLVLLAVALLDELVHVGMGGAPRYEKPKPQTAEEVIQQAIQSAV